MKNLVYTVVVIALVVGAVGFYRGWLDITRTDRPAEQKVQVGVEVDKQRAREDIDAAKEKVEALGQRVEERVQESTERAEQRSDEIVAEDAKVSGTIRTVDATTRMVTVATAEGRQVTVKVAESAPITVDGTPGELAALKAGDRVTLLLRSTKDAAIDVDVNRS